MLYRGAMSVFSPGSRALSVTEAAARGVAGLLRDAEEGADVVVARWGHPVAAVVSMCRLSRLREPESNLRDISLVLTRMATDTGVGVELDQIISEFGFDRAELEAELDADLAAGRE
jgi:antitoxin (DNA-binding transcriptional repressor) of toxin-antitoxin stability system